MKIEQSFGRIRNSFKRILSNERKRIIISSNWSEIKKKLQKFDSNAIEIKHLNKQARKYHQKLKAKVSQEEREREREIAEIEEMEERDYLNR